MVQSGISKTHENGAEGTYVLFIFNTILSFSLLPVEEIRLVEYEGRLAEKQAELAKLIAQRNELMAAQKKLLKLQELSLQVRLYVFLF